MAKGWGFLTPVNPETRALEKDKEVFVHQVRDSCNPLQCVAEKLVAIVKSHLWALGSGVRVARHFYRRKVTQAQMQRK